MRAFVKENPWMAQYLRDPEAVAPRPANVAPKGKERQRPSRAYDGTIDSPGSSRAPSEDPAIHHEIPPTPMPGIVTPATTAPRATTTTAPSAPPTPTIPNVPPSMTNPPTSEQTRAAESRDSATRNATNTVAKGKGKGKANVPGTPRHSHNETSTARRGRSSRRRRRT
jgi:hypothetical protein